MPRPTFSWRPAICLVAGVLAVGLPGCSSAPESPDAAPAPASSEQVRAVKRLAYRQMKALSRRTCAAVPRRVLWRSLAAVSDDPRTASGPGDDNGIALLYAEDVAIQVIPLQRAAYDGCIAGLESQP